MEPIDDAEFWLPPEFLTDDDFLVKKQNMLFNDDESKLFPYELSHGLGFGSTVKPTGDEESYLTGLTRKMVQSTLEDDFSGGFCGNHAFPAGNHNKAWGESRCEAGSRRNLNCPTRVSSHAAAWDLYCAAVEELAMMNINGYNNHSGRGVIDLPRKHPLTGAKTPNDGSGYYSRQSLQYQKLQALRFQQLKQQHLMQQRRGLKANNNKIAGNVDFSPSAWSNQSQRRDDGSGMRAVFLGDRTWEHRSSGTGVFLPRRVNHTVETREKPRLATVLVPARVAQVLNLDESVVQPSLRSSASLNDASWRQRSNHAGLSSQMKMEQGVNEPRLPLDWAY